MDCVRLIYVYIFLANFYSSQSVCRKIARRKLGVRGTNAVVFSFCRGAAEGDFASAISLYHAYELLPTHGLRPFYKYVLKISDDGSGDNSNTTTTSDKTSTPGELLKTYTYYMVIGKWICFVVFVNRVQQKAAK